MIRWRYITGNAESASKGLASDEFLIGNYGKWAASGFPEPTLRIYTYKSDCALVGRFQNAEAEVYLDECQRLGIEVNRRPTGGGAILMGERQLMISIATSSEHPSIPAHPARILPKLARGIIVGLESLGIPAEYRAKNDIVVNGRKIGGSAIFVEENGALLYHATVLADFDVPLMLRTLSIPDEKLSDKEFNSHEDRMTSMSRELGEPIDIEKAREAICRGFEHAFKMSASHVPFTPVEAKGIGRMERDKYLTDEWVYQRQPAPDMTGTSTVKTPGGLVRIHVALAGDTIKSILITGDFLSGDRAVKDIEAALKWSRSDRESITRAIRVAMSNTDTAIQGISASDLTGIILEAIHDAHQK